MSSTVQITIPPDIPDEELVALLQNKATAEQAFAFLVQQQSPRLYSAIRRIVYRHDDADDILQETFIKVWKNISTFRGNSKLSTWIYSIATNEALSHLRKEKRQRKLPLETDEYDLAAMLKSEPYFNGDELVIEFMNAIDKLPEKQKLTFELRYFEELPYNEISEITGTSVGALKANYHHATKKLHKYLGVDESLDWYPEITTHKEVLGLL